MKTNSIVALLTTLALAVGCHHKGSKSPSQGGYTSPPPDSKLDRMLEKAFSITDKFEGPGKWSNITGDFDGMGLTCGRAGLTFSNGEQQRHVKAFVNQHGANTVKRYMPKTGEDYLRLINSENRSKATKEISTWSTPGRMQIVREPYKSELERFWGSPEMKQYQISLNQRKAVIVDRLAKIWDENYSTREFCHFFDLHIFHGISQSEVRSQKAKAEQYRSVSKNALLDEVEAWARTLKPKVRNRKGELVDISGHNARLLKNVGVWRGISLSTDRKMLLAQGFIESRDSTNVQFEAVSMNRIGLIIFGRGYVYDSSIEDVTGILRNAD